MIRKTMRIGLVRTSIKLEKEFWDYLRETAGSRSLRLSALVNEVARATPDRTNLASTLRTYALVHAQLRCHTLQKELDRLQLAGNTHDLAKVIEACPLPCLLLDDDRAIRQLNRAFAQWLNLDVPATIGRRLDTIMILRAAGLKDLWQGLFDGHQARGAFSATYVSPGKVRTAQALAVAMSPSGAPPKRACLVIFETLSGRN